MDFNFDYDLVRSQKLLLSPHLKQAMKILEMNSQRLTDYVEAQAETNPVLEINYGCELTNEEPALSVEAAFSKITLKEYLLLQLVSAIDGNLENAIGEYLIDNTDENGYLTTSVEETADFFNIPVSYVEKVLNILQSFDPPGICARNLKECLLIQLKQNNEIDSAAIEIVDKYLNELAAGDSTAVAEGIGICEARILEIFKSIKTLEPRPGREFYTDDELKPVIADVIVKRLNGKFTALMNDDAIPVADIGDSYNSINTGTISEDDSIYIQSRLDNAIWLIKCLEQRKNIILKVAEVIVKEQQDFFNFGFKCLKSITTEYISNILNIHESLINSALKGKYLQCRWGTFELMYFCKT